MRRAFGVHVSVNKLNMSARVFRSTACFYVALQNLRMPSIAAPPPRRRLGGRGAGQATRAAAGRFIADAARVGGARAAACARRGAARRRVRCRLRRARRRRRRLLRREAGGRVARRRAAPPRGGDFVFGWRRRTKVVADLRLAQRRLGREVDPEGEDELGVSMPCELPACAIRLFRPFTCSPAKASMVNHSPSRVVTFSVITASSVAGTRDAPSAFAIPTGCTALPRPRLPRASAAAGTRATVARCFTPCASSVFAPSSSFPSTSRRNADGFGGAPSACTPGAPSAPRSPPSAARPSSRARRSSR